MWTGRTSIGYRRESAHATQAAAAGRAPRKRARDDSTERVVVESRAVPHVLPHHEPDSRLMLEPAPCDRCRLAERCKAKRLACRAFSLFMAGASPIEWNEVNRSPTRERYEALLGAGTTA
jgi:hypothetical protein